MPNSLLIPLPHKTQEEDAGCLAACTQMLLGWLGIEATQSDLNRLFGLTMGGVPLSRLARLETIYRVRVTIRQGEAFTIADLIQNNQPLIIFVRTSELSYWSIDTRHAVVVIGYDEESILLNDPAFQQSPQPASPDEVMLAWLEFDYQYATIEKLA